MALVPIAIKVAPILMLKNSLPHIIGTVGDLPASESAGAWSRGIKNCCAHSPLCWEHNDAAVKNTTRPPSLLVCEKQASLPLDLDDVNRQVELQLFLLLPSVVFCLFPLILSISFFSIHCLFLSHSSSSFQLFSPLPHESDTHWRTWPWFSSRSSIQIK